MTFLQFIFNVSVFPIKIFLYTYINMSVPHGLNNSGSSHVSMGHHTQQRITRQKRRQVEISKTHQRRLFLPLHF